MGALNVFTFYDGPGPIFGQYILWAQARDAEHQARIALQRNGLYETSLAPVRTIQEIALRAPSIDWEAVTLFDGGGNGT